MGDLSIDFVIVKSESFLKCPNQFHVLKWINACICCNSLTFNPSPKRLESSVGIWPLRGA